MSDTSKDDGDLLGDLGKTFDDLHEETQEGLEEAQQELREAMRPPSDAPESPDAPRASRTRKPPKTGEALAAHRKQRVTDDYDPTLEHEFETDADDLRRYEESANIAPAKTREHIVATSGAQGLLDVYRNLGRKAKTKSGRPPKVRVPRGRAPAVKKQLDKLKDAFEKGYNE